MITKPIAASLAAAMMFAMPSAASAVQVLSFSGNLQNGFNNSGPFAAANTSLTGAAYSVSLSYDPTQFVTSNFAINSCGPNAGTTCTIAFSPLRTLTEVITVNGVAQNNVFTAGTLTLNSSGNDNFSFSFQGPSLSMSGGFTDGNGFFPNQANVNNPVFSSFSALATSQGSFNQSGPGYSVGANPSALAASTVAAPGAVPEPATWAMMLVGFGMIGFGMRRRKVAAPNVNYSYA